MSEPGEISKKPETGLKSSPELYVDVVASDGFIQALRKAAKITQRTGHEAGFWIGLTNNNEYWISLVRRGNASGMDRDPETKREKREDIKEFQEGIDLDPIDLVDVHFHPSCDPAPSPDDLAVLSGQNGTADEKQMPRIVGGIGIVDKKGEINLLLVRISSKGIPGDFLIEDVALSLEDIEFFLGDLLPSDSKKSELLSLLNNTGFYKAIFVSLPNGEDTWPDTEIERLRAFFK